MKQANSSPNPISTRHIPTNDSIIRKRRKTPRSGSYIFIYIEKEKTTIVKGAGKAKDIEGRVAQIKAQLERMVPVSEVHDLTAEGPAVQRELALIKVAGRGEARIEALRLAEIFRANVVDSTLESFVFEMTGTPEKIDAFADLMRPLGLREIARTGVAALARGA